MLCFMFIYLMKIIKVVFLIHSFLVFIVPGFTQKGCDFKDGIKKTV